MLKSLPPKTPILLDGQPVEKITAFLFPKGGHENPKVLLANSGMSFKGSMILGMGFTFDDTSTEATSIAEMQRLIAENPRNQERILPFIGGSEVNSSPTHAHHRYVINFGEMSEEEAREWPELMAIVEEKVKPERLKLNMNTADGRRRAASWWLWGRYTPALFRAIENCDRVLVIPSSATKYLNFVFLSSNMVFSHKLIVFPLTKFSHFSVLQSRIHLIWTTFLTATMKDDLTYNPSDCFETFPFPANWETDPTLEAVGKAYYEYRAALMRRNNQGLTDTYNRFHDPQETDPEILHLRELHHQMDRAVLTAYGWDSLDTHWNLDCGFGLDYLDLDEDKLPPAAQDRIASGDLFWVTTAEATAFDNLIQSSLKTRKKLPWRHRWAPDIHDEILARLLDLNQQRYDAEVRGGLHSKKKTAKTKGTAKAKKATQTKRPASQKQLNLIPPATEQLDLLN